jgi:autotransporter-associated beta strand protein
MRKRHRLALLAASTSTFALPMLGRAQVTIESFHNFNPDNFYGSWSTFNATITSGPTSWETACPAGSPSPQFGYGSCYYGLYTDTGTSVNATGYGMIQLSFTVNSGDAFMQVDQNDGEGILTPDRRQWNMGGYGVGPGTYVIDAPINYPSATLAAADRNAWVTGFDLAHITGMNFELDPGATGTVQNGYDVTWSDLSAVNPTLTWNNANYSTLLYANATADGATWVNAINDYQNLNWNNGTNASPYADGAYVTFNDTNSGNYAVTVGGTVNPGSVTVNNSLGNYSFSGAGSIAGTGSITKSGTGKLTLNTANTYTGGTTVTGGTIALGSPTALGFGGLVNGLPGSTSVSANGTIDLAGQTVTQPITLNGGSLINSNTGTTAGVTSGVLGVGIVTNTSALSGDAHLVYSGSGGAAASLALGISPATFTLTNGGSGYNNAGRSFAASPTVTVTGGGGTGAVLQAITSTAGVVTGIDIISPGIGFTSAPTITISAPLSGGTQATVTSFNLFGLYGIQQTAAGSGYFTAPTATITATSGSATLGTPVLSGINLAGTGNVGGPGNINLAGVVSGVGMLDKIGTGTVTMTAPNTYGGGTTVSGGTLVAGVSGALPSGAVSITGGGTLQLAASTGLATITSLAITGNGAFDITNNHVIVNYGSGADPVSSIAAMLSAGYNNGLWNGVNGINSSAVAANPGYGVGYADFNDPGNPAGLASGTLEVKFTLLGDADLNGTVNGIDFGILAANFNKGVSRWDQGDFNYDNIVNGVDFGSLAANFNKGASSASDIAALDAFAAANGLLADVPEPASIGLIALGACGLMARRRHKPTT